MNAYPRQSATRHTAFRGFTLLELIAVLVIIALTMAMAAPSLRGFAASQETQETARNMLTLLQLGRMNAISEARVYRLNVHPQERTYWLTAAEGGEFTPPADHTGRRFTLPAGVTVEWIVPSRGSSESYITINPNGTMEPATLRLISRTASAFDLTSTAPAEPFTIQLVEEEISR